MSMDALRSQQGNSMITVVLVLATMLVLGTATLAVVDTQSAETRITRTNEAAFNLAEATLKAQAFLLARNWPQTGTAGTCNSKTVNGTLSTPAATLTTRDQIQSILANTYTGDANNATSQWWVTTCAEGGRDSWDSSLLNGLSYDSAAASTGPRRLWVRAEARVNGRTRSVVGLVQAGQSPAFPTNLAVVTGTLGADLGTALATLTNGPLLGGLLGLLLNQDPMFVGNVGLRCNILDPNVQLLGCLSGLLKITTPLLGPLLQSNNFVDFASDQAISDEKIAQLRQQAQANGTYYPNTATGGGGVAANAACLPAASAGKVIFIEQVGDGTASCLLNTAANPSAKALIVGSGGIRITGGGTFTGVVYALRGKALAADVADVRIEGGSRVSGAVFVDDNPALGSKAHGQVNVIVPPPNLCNALQGSGLLSILQQLICNTLPINFLLSLLGVNMLLPQLSQYLPAVVYNGPVVNAVTTFNNSELVAGTFRQVPAQN